MDERGEKLFKPVHLFDVRETVFSYVAIDGSQLFKNLSESFKNLHKPLQTFPNDYKTFKKPLKNLPEAPGKVRRITHQPNLSYVGMEVFQPFTNILKPFQKQECMGGHLISAGLSMSCSSAASMVDCHALVEFGITNPKSKHHSATQYPQFGITNPKSKHHSTTQYPQFGITNPKSKHHSATQYPQFGITNPKSKHHSATQYPQFRAENVQQSNRSSGRQSFERRKEMNKEYVLMPTHRISKTIRIFPLNFTYSLIKYPMLPQARRTL
jgi:hypothetical protein